MGSSSEPFEGNHAEAQVPARSKLFAGIAERQDRAESFNTIAPNCRVLGCAYNKTACQTRISLAGRAELWSLPSSSRPR